MYLKIKDSKVLSISSVSPQNTKVYKNENTQIIYSADYLAKIDSKLNISEIDTKKLLEKLCHLNEKQVAVTISKLMGTYYFIKVRNNKIEWIITDLSAAKRLYRYDNLHSVQYIFDDFDEFITLSKESISIDNKEKKYFIEHGHCSCGKTFITNLSRFQPGILYGKKTYDLLDLFPYDFSIDYQTFKRVFENIIAFMTQSKTVYLLHSGGADSNAIFMSLIKMNKPFISATGINCRKYLFNLMGRDLKRSKAICSQYKVPHLISKIDYHNFSRFISDDYIKRMPFDYHWTMPFDCLMSDISRHLDASHNNTIILAGQNADSIIGLGPTEPVILNILRRGDFKAGLEALGKRILISNFYVGLTEKNSRFKHLIDAIIQNVLFHISKDSGWWNFPDNAGEVVDYFFNSSTYRAISAKKPLKCPYNCNRKNYKQLMFKIKLRSFIDGPDPKVIYSMASKYNLLLCLPYSMQPLLYFFYKKNYDFRDIWFPKYYIYKYLRSNGFPMKIMKTPLNKKDAPYTDFICLLKKELKINQSQSIYSIWLQKFKEKYMP